MSVYRPFFKTKSRALVWPNLQKPAETDPYVAYFAHCGSLSLWLSLALSQSERARENLCGSLWLSVAICGSLTLPLSLALFLALWLDHSLINEVLAQNSSCAFSHQLIGSIL